MNTETDPEATVRMVNALLRHARLPSMNTLVLQINRLHRMIEEAHAQRNVPFYNNARSIEEIYVFAREAHALVRDVPQADYTLDQCVAALVVDTVTPEVGVVTVMGHTIVPDGKNVAAVNHHNTTDFSALERRVLRDADQTVALDTSNLTVTGRAKSEPQPQYKSYAHAETCPCGRCDQRRLDRDDRYSI